MESNLYIRDLKLHLKTLNYNKKFQGNVVKNSYAKNCLAWQQKFSVPPAITIFNGSSLT